MSVYERNGTVMVYRLRFVGLLTPRWLDRGKTPLARHLGRRMGRMGLLSRRFYPADGSGVRREIYVPLSADKRGYLSAMRRATDEDGA